MQAAAPLPSRCPAVAATRCVRPPDVGYARLSPTLPYDHRMSNSPRGSTPPRAAPPARSGRVALVGRPNVGKSTLLNALLGETISIVSHHPQTTRDAVRGVLTRAEAQYVFVDTPGVHAPRTRLGRWMNEVALQSARDADVLVLVVEAPRDPQEERRRHSIEADRTLASELPKLPTVLALSKVDRVADKTMLLPSIAALTESGAFAATVPISARRKDGLEPLLDEIRLLLPEQPRLFEPETLSDQPERFFVSELIREQILLHTRQEVPHGIAVVIERFDETVHPIRIEAAVLVARDSHIKIVVGAGGRTAKRIGTVARARIERMLGARVHLELDVRAARDWMNDDARLRELGYGAGAAGPGAVTHGAADGSLAKGTR
jgi:GTPase